MWIEIVLVSLAVLTGVVWALDVWLWRDKRVAVGGVEEPAEPVAVEYARSFFPVIVIVLVIRSFLFEPFRIPSDSMVPTLLDGDFIFVNKFTYGLRLPITNTQIVEFRKPRRGDVVVFRQPDNPDTNFIKRLVGLPGDRIEYRDKQLYINGEPVPRDVNGAYEGPARNLPVGRNRPRVARENLDGAEHDILLSRIKAGKEGTFSVPDGHYFFMGDNRDNSHDSRYPGVSYVPERNIVGKAVRIWMNWDVPHAAPIWARIGDRIQ